MKLDITITEVACPHCGLIDAVEYNYTDRCKIETNALLPKEVTCGQCTKKYNLVASVIVSADKIEADSKPYIPSLFRCNDCLKITGLPYCPYCGSNELTPEII